MKSKKDIFISNVFLGVALIGPWTILWAQVQKTSPASPHVETRPASSGLSLRYGEAQAQTPGRIAKFDVNLDLVDSVVIEDDDKIGIGTAMPGALLEIGQDNTKPALLLTHPDSQDPAWDNSPISALKITAPPTPTTRNFVAGIWVETGGAQVDKGRGLLVHNVGKSDGIYVQQDGSEGTGLAILQTSNSLSSTGAVVGTTLSTQKALVLRQETALKPDAQSNSLLELEANGSGTEMVRLNSNIVNQVGIISRMTGMDAKPFVVKNSSEGDVFVLGNSGSAYFAGNVGLGTTNPAAKLHVIGDFIATGSKSALVETASHGKRQLYAVESTENWFEDFGTAALKGTGVRISIDEIFAQTVDTKTGYHVFLTPTGNCSLYVSEKRSMSFKVSLRDGDPRCEFDYRIVAKRKGYERVRLAELK